MPRAKLCGHVSTCEALRQQCKYGHQSAFCQTCKKTVQVFIRRPSQNMQRFDAQLAKDIRNEFAAQDREALVETVEWMYKSMLEVKKLMDINGKESAKEIYGRLKVAAEGHEKDKVN